MSRQDIEKVIAALIKQDRRDTLRAFALQVARLQSALEAAEQALQALTGAFPEGFFEAAPVDGSGLTDEMLAWDMTDLSSEAVFEPLPEVPPGETVREAKTCEPLAGTETGPQAKVLPKAADSVRADFKERTNKALKEAVKEAARPPSAQKLPEPAQSLSEADAVLTAAASAGSDAPDSGPRWYQRACDRTHVSKNRTLLAMLASGDKVTLSSVIYAFRPPLKETYALNVISDVRRLLKEDGWSLDRDAEGVYAVSRKAVSK
tara:strand:- start:42646 stop:43431 length:786 start_codon:yes stop_codon:yes gene_type:complete